MAYHALARSLEAAAFQAPTGRQRFAASVEHALFGFVPNARHRLAGRAIDSSRPSEAAIESIVAETLCCDLNPFAQCMLRAPTRRGALLAHRSFNESGLLNVRMSLGLGPDGELSVLSRSAPADGEDPFACRDVHLMGMGLVMDSVGEPAWAGSRPRPPRVARANSVGGVAAMLGLASSAAGEAAAAFDADACLSVAGLAVHLGCHPRTLQRELRRFGLSAETLRRACMLSRAVGLLSEPITLTEAAHRSGYADQAHMTRAFVASCGLPPSVLRKALSPQS